MLFRDNSQASKKTDNKKDAPTDVFFTVLILSTIIWQN